MQKVFASVGRSFSLFLLMILLAGCSQTRIASEKESTVDTADYTLIAYIHGDSGYLFHKPDGTPAMADVEALERVIELSEQASSGRVIIFYQAERSRTLHIFPRRTSVAFHYVGGELQQTIRYRADLDQISFLEQEHAIYREIMEGVDHSQSPLFFYFAGHEIPANNGYGYHRSIPHLPVNSETFASGLEQFTESADDLFDLVILSSCSNGTPDMARELIPVADRLLASPQNLHLSHIDPRPFLGIENDPDRSTSSLANSIAEKTFQTLTGTIQTVVTLSLYDLRIVETYIENVYTAVKFYESEAEPNPYGEGVDCGSITELTMDGYTDGVETWFKPPGFGSGASADGHSGWGCKPAN